MKHGMSKTRPYHIWQNMKHRCFYEKHGSYKDYGGNGITVCDRWKNSFKNFWEDMKDGYSDKLEIDRIDGSDDYKPSNCRWATSQQQKQNKRKKDNTSSKYKGVDYKYSHYKGEKRIRPRPWLCRIALSGKTFNIGYFENEIDAGVAYDSVAMQLFGEYACTNFEYDTI